MAQTAGILPIGSRWYCVSVTAPASGGSFASIASLLSAPDIAAIGGYTNYAASVIIQAISTALDVQDTNGGSGTMNVAANTLFEIPVAQALSQVKIRSSGGATAFNIAILFRSEGLG